jgi:hypothetical protein
LRRVADLLPRPARGLRNAMVAGKAFQAETLFGRRPLQNLIDFWSVKRYISQAL